MIQYLLKKSSGKYEKKKRGRNKTSGTQGVENKCVCARYWVESAHSHSAVSLKSPISITFLVEHVWGQENYYLRFLRHNINTTLNVFQVISSAILTVSLFSTFFNVMGKFCFFTFFFLASTSFQKNYFE